jgi:phosphate starvation-inducible PhoH-like protein
MNKKIKLAIELTEEQQEATEIIKNHVVSSVRGVNGVGKSATVFSYILQELLTDKTKEVFITKPPVEAVFNLGFLPGDLESKTEIYHKIIFEIIKSLFIGEAKDFNAKEKQLERLMQRIHTFDISFLRGVTFKANSIVVVEEFQNMPLKALELVVGRIGKGAKVIMIGDENQIDVKKSGIHKWIEVAKTTGTIGDIKLIENHRDPVAMEIVELLKD